MQNILQRPQTLAIEETFVKGKYGKKFFDQWG